MSTRSRSGAAAGLTVRWHRTVRRLRRTSRDPLTGLPGRDELELRAPEALDDATGDGRSAAVLVLDLDGFKGVNDTVGHDIGDRLLREVASRLRSVVGPDDVVVRLGGDEFAVLTTGHASPAGAEDLAAAVVRAVGAPWRVDELELGVGVSVGLAHAGADGTTLTDLLRAADQAMYAAKREGRGRGGPGSWRGTVDRRTAAVRLRRDGAEPTDTRTPELLRDLRAPELPDQLVVHYQPQVDLRSGLVVGFESLARWDHPRFGLLDAREFVPLAERSGLMGPITETVLDQALGAHAALQSAVPGARLSLNVTRRHLLSHDPLHGLLARVERLGIPHGDLVLEVTEPLGAAAPETGDLFARIDKQGIGVSVRGFGTSGSSLTALWSNPAACEVKIDPSVVHSVVTDPNSRRLVRALVSAGHALGMRVVAMGVEHGEIADALHDLQCDVGQGFWFCRPGPLDAVLRWTSVRAAC